MTILALDTAVSSALKTGTMFSQDASKLSKKCDSRPLPTRINLRKRSSCGNVRRMNLTTVNSAFLSGLFADVAQATTIPVPEDQQPSKKSRISKTKSLARCGRSYKELARVQDTLERASAITVSIPVCENSPVKANTSFFAERQDSLHYQLDCVSSSFCSSTDTSSGNKGSKLAFPLLPALITSNSSCNNKQLTRVVSDLQSSVAETSEQSESYGWFVDMEDEQASKMSDRAVDPYASASGSHSLAFQANTAPKANNQDAEVEWAKAADTVDDVLGDFF